MQVKWLRTALINLDREASYIAKEDPKVARLVVQRIQSSVALWGSDRVAAITANFFTG